MNLINSIENGANKSGLASLWFLGGSSFALKFQNRPVIFFDLDASRFNVDVPPSGRAPGFKQIRTSFLPFDIHDISKPAVYLSTHEHLDHCDKLAALSVIAKGGVFVGPRSSCEQALLWGVSPENIVSLDGEKFERTRFGEVSITAAPGRDPNAKNSNTYVVSYDGVTVLHNGDSLYDGPTNLEISSRFKIDVAVINLGKNPKGEHWYHTPYDVARAANDLNPRVVIPHHYDKWDKIREDPAKIMVALRSSYSDVLGRTRLKIIKPGFRILISSDC